MNAEKLIKLKEDERKNLILIKIELEKIKPIFFQKKKLSNYYKLLNKIENEIKEIDVFLLNAYIKKENRI